MKKQFNNDQKKKLELKKKAIAQLTLSESQMKAIVGGDGLPPGKLTEHTSRAIPGDETNCTVTGGTV